MRRGNKVPFVGNKRRGEKNLPVSITETYTPPSSANRLRCFRKRQLTSQQEQGWSEKRIPNGSAPRDKQRGLRITLTLRPSHSSTAKLNIINTELENGQCRRCVTRRETTLIPAELRNNKSSSHRSATAIPKIAAGFQQVTPALKQTRNPFIAALAKRCFLSWLFIPAVSLHGFSFQEGYCKGYFVVVLFWFGFFVFFSLGHHL